VRREWEEYIQKEQNASSPKETCGRHRSHPHHQYFLPKQLYNISVVKLQIDKIIRNLKRKKERGERYVIFRKTLSVKKFLVKIMIEHN
jgi:hypothetical protein